MKMPSFNKRQGKSVSVTEITSDRVRPMKFWTLLFHRISEKEFIRKRKLRPQGLFRQWKLRKWECSRRIELLQQQYSFTKHIVKCFRRYLVKSRLLNVSADPYKSQVLKCFSSKSLVKNTF